MQAVASRPNMPTIVYTDKGFTLSETETARGGARVAIQKFGTFLSGMIMPNIPALIA